MSADDLLKSSERSALNNNQFVAHVSGKKVKGKTSKKLSSWGAVSFLVAMVALAAIIFGSGNFIPANLHENLIQQTDVQYADMVESKKIILQQALASGEIPSDTVAILKDNDILVGYIKDDQFIEGVKRGTSLVLKNGNEIITADNFIEKVSTDAKLYDAINKATYDRAAGYYDEAAMKVFEEIGTSRNNYSEDSDLDEIMNSVMGSGSDVNINSVSLVQKTHQNNETGETETYYEYQENGSSANSKTKAAAFVESVGNKNSASSEEEATLNSADTLKVADTISKEQRSSLFYALFMENISKMKAGDGNESKINEAMNYLYEKAETEVVDVRTGELTKVVGSALDSPSLYAILSGNRVDASDVENYSSDRILKTIENQIGKDSSSNGGTVVSSEKNKKGSIGRFIDDGIANASNAILSLVEPTVSSSMVNNSYSDTKGIGAGETLVEGAVNVGKMLAKSSGATSGDASAVASYARLNSTVLAMDARVDRMNRSPFDISSKNTFLGSIMYRFAIASLKFSGIWSGVKTFSSSVISAIASLSPASYANESDGYLMTFGDCKTYAAIGAVGSAQCAEIATFDTSTLNDPLNDPGFINFVNNNTTIDTSGVRKINNNSTLANFILYNDERKTPLGVIDGGILDSLNNNSNTIPFVSNITKMVEMLLGSSDRDKKIASGEAFVNSSSNPDWQNYKYAQRYVSLARATSILKQYSSDETAYNNIKFFEGKENPVIAFIEQNNTLANR